MESLVQLGLTIADFIAQHPALQVTATNIFFLTFLFIFDYFTSASLGIGNPHIAYIARLIVLLMSGTFVMILISAHNTDFSDYGVISYVFCSTWALLKNKKRVNLYGMVLFAATTLYLFFSIELLAFVEECVVPTVVFSLVYQFYAGIAKKIGGQMAVWWGNNSQE